MEVGVLEVTEAVVEVTMEVRDLQFLKTYGIQTETDIDIGKNIFFKLWEKYLKMFCCFRIRIMMAKSVFLKNQHW